MEYRFCHILAVLLLCLCPSILTPLTPDIPSLFAEAQTCPPRPVPPPSTSETGGDHGALGPLISSAKSTREAILGHDLPYSIIREEIQKQ